MHIIDQRLRGFKPETGSEWHSLGLATLRSVTKPVQSFLNRTWHNSAPCQLQNLVTNRAAGRHIPIRHTHAALQPVALGKWTTNTFFVKENLVRT